MNSSKPDSTGMTVNERLFTAGLLDAFDAAIAEVGLADQAESIADSAVARAENEGSQDSN